MKYYKRNDDGSIAAATTVHGNGWTLDGKDEDRDGWMPFETDEEAYAFFASPANDRLTDMDSVFETLPPEVQEMFEPAWTTVRNLVQAGKLERAHRFISSLAIPEDLASTRESILEHLT
jgi:hypothetical protein